MATYRDLLQRVRDEIREVTTAEARTPSILVPPALIDVRGAPWTGSSPGAQPSAGSPNVTERRLASTDHLCAMTRSARNQDLQEMGYRTGQHGAASSSGSRTAGR
jgi:hypothetical protein